MHVETRSMSFLVEPQNQGRQFMSGLASKPLRRFSLVWPQNRCRWVSRFGPQNRKLRVGDLGLKITVTVSWFGLQNQAGLGLSVAPKTDGGRTVRDMHRDLPTCFTWKQVVLAFPSLASRLAETRWWVVNVASSRRSHGVQVEDERVDVMGCVGPCYPYLLERAPVLVGNQAAVHNFNYKAPEFENNSKYSPSHFQKITNKSPKFFSRYLCNHNSDFGDSCAKILRIFHLFHFMHS
jgi:hypothetical protein